MRGSLARRHSFVASGMLLLVAFGLFSLVFAGAARAAGPISITIASGPLIAGEAPVFTNDLFSTNKDAVLAGIADGSVVRLPGVSGFNDLTFTLDAGSILVDDDTRSIGLSATATVAGEGADLLLVAQWTDDLSVIPNFSLGVHFSDLDLSNFDASWHLPAGDPAPVFPDTWITLSTGDQAVPASSATWPAFYPDAFTIVGPGVSHRGTAVLQSVLGQSATEALGFDSATLVDLSGDLGTTWGIFNGDLTDTALSLGATLPAAPGAVLGGWLQASAPWTFGLDFDLGSHALNLGMAGEVEPTGELAGAFPPVTVTGAVAYTTPGDVTTTLSGDIGTWDDVFGIGWLDLTDVSIETSFVLVGGAAEASTTLRATFDADGAGGVDPFAMSTVFDVVEGPPAVVSATFTIEGSHSMADIAALFAAQGFPAAEFPDDQTFAVHNTAFSVSTTVGVDDTLSITADTTVLGGVDVGVLIGLTRTVGGGDLLLLGIKTSDLSMADLFAATSPGLSGSVVGEISMPGVEYTVAIPIGAITPPYEIDAADLSAAARAFYGQDLVRLHLEGAFSINGTVDLASVGPDLVDALNLDDGLVDFTGAADATFDWGDGGAAFELTGLDLTAALPDAEVTLPDWLSGAVVGVGEPMLHFAYAGGAYTGDVTTAITADIDGVGADEVIDVTVAFGYTSGAFDFAATGVIGDWVDPFGMNLTVHDATMALALSPGSATATFSGTIPLSGADLGVTATFSTVDNVVSADFRLDLDGNVPLSDIVGLAEHQLGGTLDLGSAELESLLIGPGSITIHVGADPSFLMVGRTTYKGVVVDILFSVDSSLDFTVGIRMPNTGFTFGDLDPALGSPAADFGLPDLTIVVTNTAVEAASGDLDPAVFDFFKEVHGCDAGDLQSDCSFDLELQEGVSILAKVPLPESFASVKDALWIDDNPVLIKGFVPLFGATGEPRLEAILPPITPPPGAAPEWFVSGQLSFYVSPSAFGLDGAMTVAMDGEHLTFVLGGELQTVPTPSLTLSGELQTEEPWVSPFGIGWLTINGLRIELGVSGTVTVGFRGDVVVAGKDLDSSVLVAITPAGVPVLEGIRGSSVEGFTLAELATFQYQVAAAGVGVPIDVAALTASLPSMSMKSVEFMYSTVSNPGLCLEPGIVFAGDLYINPLGTAPGGPVPGGGCQQIPERPVPSAYCIMHRFEGCFASMRIEVTEDGIVGVGSLPGFSIGSPTVLVIGDAQLDLVVDSSGQTLQLSGSAQIPNFTSGELTLEVTKFSRAFEGDFQIYGVFFAYVDGSFSVDPSAVFDFGSADFHVHAIMRADFTSAVSAAVEPLMAEMRRVFGVISPLWNSLQSLSTSPDPIGVLAAVPGQMQAVGLPPPQFLVDMTSVVGQIQNLIGYATGFFEDAGIPVPGISTNPLDLINAALNGFTFPVNFPGLEIPFIPETCVTTWVGSSCYSVPPTGNVYATVCAPWPWDDECATILVIPALPGVPGVVTPEACIGAVVGGKCYALGLVPIDFPGIPGLCDVIPGPVVGLGRTWVGSHTPECNIQSLINASVGPALSGVLGSTIGIPSIPPLSTALANLSSVFSSGGTLFSLDCAEFTADIGGLQGSKIVNLGVAATALGQPFGLSAQWDFDHPADSAFGLFKSLLTGVIFGTPQHQLCAGTALGQIVPPPHNLQLSGGTVVTENGAASIHGTFESDPAAAHTVTVDWHDGAAQTITLPAGVSAFDASHQYLDDRPTATAADNYSVSVKVNNPATGSVSATRTIRVDNVRPTFIGVSVAASVVENGSVTVSGSFTDPGAQDTHTVTIDWKDGAPTVIQLAVGQLSFSAAHQYLDDNPSHTPADVYAVAVSVRDDDTGSDATTRNVTVTNALSGLSLVYSATDSVNDQWVSVPFGPAASVAIDEGKWLTVSGTFTDPGSLDTHHVVIDWSDGPTTVIDLTHGERSFEVRHRFLDDNPTVTPSDTYPVTVTLDDDDTATLSAQRIITVNNVTPHDVQLSFGLLAVDENKTVVLNGNFVDPGVTDVHTVTVDWGDGSASNTLVLPHDFPSNPPVRDFRFEHQYLDDNPTLTPLDEYTLTVTLSDDDGGIVDPANMTTTFQAIVLDNNGVPIRLSNGDFQTTVETMPHPIARVANVPPVVEFTVTPSIVENDTVALDGWFVDPGTFDSHTICIDWGDGRAASGVLLGAPSDFAACAARSGRTVDGISMAADPHRVFDAPRLFGLTHQYLDDNPTGTSSDAYTVSVFVLDDDTGEGTANHAVRVDDVAPVITVTPTNQDPQYSDPLHQPIVYTVTDVAADTLVASTDWQYEGGGWQDGLPAALAFSFDGCTPGGFVGEVEPRQTCLWSVDGIVDVAPGIYTIRIKVVDDDGLFTYRSAIIDVQPEDARLFYTGPTNAAGVADASGITRIPLRATVKDITVSDAGDPAWDAYPGDITHAVVYFVDRATGRVLCSSTVGRVFAGDEGRGSAACWWEVSLGSRSSMPVHVAVMVGWAGATETVCPDLDGEGRCSWYTRDSSSEDTTVTIVQPSKNHVTANNELIASANAAGVYRPDAGTAIESKIEVKFDQESKRWTKLDGKVEIEFVSGGRSYVIEATSLDTLGMVPTGKKTGYGFLDVRVVLTDVTVKKSPVVVASNVPLHVTLTDAGSPGDGDAIGLSLWSNGGELLFSTGWHDVRTVDQAPHKGNLELHFE